MTFKNQKDYLKYLNTRNVSLDKKISWAEEYLDKELGKQFEITRLKMPLKENARYSDWRTQKKRYGLCI